jgi:hypothetical protein
MRERGAGQRGSGAVGQWGSGAVGQWGSGAVGPRVVQSRVPRYVIPSGARDRVADALGNACPGIKPHSREPADPSLRSG